MFLEKTTTSHRQETLYRLYCVDLSEKCPSHDLASDGGLSCNWFNRCLKMLLQITITVKENILEMENLELFSSQFSAWPLGGTQEIHIRWVSQNGIQATARKQKQIHLFI